MMESLEAILKAKGIPFCRIGNRIRCFPHVVNIAVQTGVRQLTDIPDDVYHDNVATTDPYLDALRADPVVQARDLVRVSRASQQRREEFQDTIKEGNTQKAFGDQPLPEAVLLQDVDTRWSSLYLMIDRVLELYQAVHKFLQRPRQDAIKHYALSREALEVLQDVREFLQAPHMVQEVLSAQKTPTLSMALPGYEKLIVLLRLLRKKLPRIAHGIDASIRKLEEYLGRSRETKIYVIAMGMTCSHSLTLTLTISLVINPTMKIEWLRKNWGERDGNEARKLLRDTVR
ncbi:uncharacterized protein C8Q71DRAFT_697693 [Rhodofomes roseus]|uniref:Uncharacterized protein n=1 Tax=Rhodofomes roseus TaxID=34475 RepID=A0ABQ8KZZ7_9APHY|nr:uncharacterized protein C8Q71DRAFT_697693 [Rhodofomes roseus]KAH9844360.1 hypothetical protein C8Q71DRAFT_697693 [Rhodofomes roseus]